MLKYPFALIFFLLLVEITVLYLANHVRFKKYFNFLPAVFWIYFLPMLASTAGLIDAQSPIYSLITTNLLPASLLLLLIAVDLKAIVRLGRPALMMFFAGSGGIILGAPLVFFLLKSWIGVEFWSGFGALSASWTGGSANMIAAKEALGTPEAVFVPMVIVDTVVPYLWMGTLVALAGIQGLYDRWNHSDRQVIDELNRRMPGISLPKTSRVNLLVTILIFATAVWGSSTASFLAKMLPEIKNVMSPYAWTIIMVSILGIGLSLTPLRKLDQFGSTKIGYFILYFVLTAIGAQANLSHMSSTILLIVAGFFLVFFHAAVVILTARLIKAPMFLAAVASQANIGGVASAPIVAEIYQPGLASVGLLLAILGNIVGTYFGILAGQLCRWTIHFY